MIQEFTFVLENSPQVITVNFSLNITWILFASSKQFYQDFPSRFRRGASKPGDAGSLPGWGPEILRAMSCSQNLKKKKIDNLLFVSYSLSLAKCFASFIVKCGTISLFLCSKTG